MLDSIKVRVENKGKKVGTVGWLHGLINESELVIKDDKDGRPAMYLVRNIRVEGQNEPKKKSIFICKPRPKWFSGEDDMIYDHWDLDGVNLVHTFVYNEWNPGIDQVGFTDAALTPAAEDVVNEIIEQACRAFVAWWESDNQEDTKAVVVEPVD